MRKPGIDRESLQFLRSTINLNQKELADMLGASEAEVRLWESDAVRPPEAIHTYILEMRELFLGLRTIMQVSDIQKWFKSAEPALNDKTPLSLIIDGEVEVVESHIAELCNRN